MVRWRTAPVGERTVSTREIVGVGATVARLLQASKEHANQCTAGAGRSKAESDIFYTTAVLRKHA